MTELDLLDRIKNKDRQAFVEFMRKYGAKLYSAMLSRLGDRKLADAAFKETMIGFYKSLTENDGEDAVSSLLSGYANEVSARLQADYFEDIIEKTADCAESSDIVKLSLPVPEANMKQAEADICIETPVKTEPAEINHAGWIFAVIILGISSAIVLWVIIGLLMAMDVIPDFNLGYTWFNNNIAHWF